MKIVQKNFNLFISLLFSVLFITSIFAEDNQKVKPIKLIGKHFTSTLPLIAIDTQGLTIWRRSEIKGHFFLLNAPSPQLNSSQDLLSQRELSSANILIRRRGHSSDKFPQKQYQLEFLKDEISLFNLPKSNKWILNAPYVDKSLMRNALAYKIAGKFPIDSQGTNNHWYAPKTRFVEVIVNGWYKGIYLLVEKLERGKDKIHIRKFDPKNPIGSDFIIKADVTDSGDRYFSTRKHRINLIHYYPKTKKIEEIKKYHDDPNMINQYEQYVQTTMNNFEESLTSGTGTDYKKTIHVQSFINYMIMQEVFKNVDGYRRSVFLHVKEGLVHAGPVWDFNLALGNLWFYHQHRTYGWQHGRKYMKRFDGNQEIPWFLCLLNNEDFKHQLITTYQELRQEGGPLHLDQIYADIDAFVNEVGLAHKRHFNKWDILGKPIKQIWFTPPPWEKTYTGEVRSLKSWIRQRLNWLDVHIPQL